MSVEPPAIVVLAAGRGSRLADAGETTPKWLLPVNGRPLAHVHLDALRTAPGSWSRLVAVVGHRSEAFDAQELSARAGRPCDLVLNADYASVNNWLSLALGLEHLERTGWAGPVCVLNSDLLLPPDRLDALLRHARDDDRTNVLATDTRRPLTDEAMKVALGADGRSVVDIGKGTLRGRAAGEYIGVSVLASEHVGAVRRVLDGFAGVPARVDEWYEAAYREAIDAGVPFSIFDIGTDDWVEIDDERDVARAAEIAGRAA